MYLCNGARLILHTYSHTHGKGTCVCVWQHESYASTRYMCVLWSGAFCRSWSALPGPWSVSGSPACDAIGSVPVALRSAPPVRLSIDRSVRLSSSRSLLDSIRHMLSPPVASCLLFLLSLSALQGSSTRHHHVDVVQKLAG